MMYKAPRKAFTKTRNEIPKSLKILFLGSQLLFGIDVGFAALLKKPYRSLAKVFTLTISFIWIVVLFLPCFLQQNDFWWWSIAVQYCAYFIILKRAKYTAYNLIKDIISINRLPCNENRETLGCFTMGHMFVVILIKSGFLYARCIYEGGDYCSNTPFTYLYWIHKIPHCGMDLFAATQFIVFVYLRCGVRSLREFLQKNAHLDTFRAWYLDLADCYDRIRPLYDNMLILELLIGVPKMMTILWFMLACLKQNAIWFAYLSELIFAFHIALQISLSAVTAELTNSEVDGIKLVLNGRLLHCGDEQKRSDMSRLLQYIESRPLNHLAWRFIPLDLRLLTSLVGLCTTYFIVIIQFTHLYD